MIPSNLVGLVLFVASLGPGYVYVRLAEVDSPRPARSTFFEAVEMAIVGALATTAAVAVVLLIGSWAGWLDLVQLFDAPRRYALGHSVASVCLGAAILTVSYLVAIGAGRMLRRSPQGVSHRPSGTGWTEAFVERRPNDSDLVVTVRTKSNELVSGQVLAYSGASGDNRELALFGPLVGGDPPRTLEAQFIILREEEIAYVAGQYRSVGDGERLDPRTDVPRQPDTRSPRSRLKAKITR